MSSTDRCPLAATPVTSLISRHANNRLGAVYSALHGFWSSRQSAFNARGQQVAGHRRDAYSIVLFNSSVHSVIINDFASSPEDLLNSIVSNHAGGGTDFTLALETAETVMCQHWSAERSPVIIFLSDGECSVGDTTVRDLCRAAIARG